MKNMGNTVKWSRKTNNPDPKRDVTKYCEFHGDYGHSTPDCISLRFEVADLLKRGHLQDLLSDKGKNTVAQREARRDEQPAEPTPERVVNIITCGSEVSGITYSANSHRRLTYDTRRPLETPPYQPNDRPSHHGDQARIPEYTLNVEPIECVAIMKNMGNTVKWPRKSNNPDPKRDITKYCEFQWRSCPLNPRLHSPML